MKYYIGIDLGGTNIRTILFDETGVAYSEKRDATEKDKGPDQVKDKIINEIASLDYSVCGGSIEGVEGIGIGVPGPVDTDNKVMIMASNLPGFTGYPICKIIEEKFGKPVFIDNDANVAGLAEACLGAGKNYKTVYFITCSTGVGGAFIVNKQLISGGRGHAGEIGNMIIVPNGRKQGALNPGAVEAEISGTAIHAKGQAAKGCDVVHHAGDVFTLAAQGDEECKKIVDDFVDGYSTMLANVALTIDPHCFVLGGGVLKSKEYFWDRLEEEFNKKIHVGMRNHIPLLFKEIDDCGAIGAAMLPMSQLK